MVVLIAPSGAASKRFLDTARSVSAWGAQLVALVDAQDTEVRALAGDVFELPPAPEPMTPLRLPLHQLSIHLAARKVAGGYVRPVKVP